MSHRFFLLLLMIGIGLSACEDDAPTVDLDTYRQLLVGDGQRNWVPQAIYYQDLDSTNVDTLRFLPGDTTANVSVLNPAVHSFSIDNRLFLSLFDGTPVDTLSWELEQPGMIVLTFDSLASDPYHQILRIDENEMLVSAQQSSVNPSYYTVYEILYRRQ